MRSVSIWRGRPSVQLIAHRRVLAIPLTMRERAYICCFRTRQGRIVDSPGQPAWGSVPRPPVLPPSPKLPARLPLQFLGNGQQCRNTASVRVRHGPRTGGGGGWTGRKGERDGRAAATGSLPPGDVPGIASWRDRPSTAESSAPIDRCRFGSDRRSGTPSVPTTGSADNPRVGTRTKGLVSHGPILSDCTAPSRRATGCNK